MTVVLGVNPVSFQAVPILRIFDVRGKAVAHGLLVSVLAAPNGHTSTDSLLQRFLEQGCENIVLRATLFSKPSEEGSSCAEGVGGGDAEPSHCGCVAIFPSMLARNGGLMSMSGQVGSKTSRSTYRRITSVRYVWSPLSRAAQMSPDGAAHVGSQDAVPHHCGLED